LAKVKNINLAKEYGVGHATINNIRKNREKIKCFVKNTDSGPSDRQTLMPGEYPGHPSEEQLKSRDGLIEVMFLLPNCTLLLQPVDQNIIQFVKLYYKKSLLCHAISQNDTIQCLKRTNLKDIIFNLAYAW
jgi:hypothetical protein